MHNSLGVLRPLPTTAPPPGTGDGRSLRLGSRPTRTSRSSTASVPASTFTSPMTTTPSPNTKSTLRGAPCRPRWPRLPTWSRTTAAAPPTQLPPLRMVLPRPSMAGFCSRALNPTRGAPASLSRSRRRLPGPPWHLRPTAGPARSSPDPCLPGLAVEVSATSTTTTTPRLPTCRGGRHPVGANGPRFRRASRRLGWLHTQATSRFSQALPPALVLPTPTRLAPR